MCKCMHVPARSVSVPAEPEADPFTIQLKQIAHTRGLLHTSPQNIEGMAAGEVTRPPASTALREPPAAWA